MDVSGRRFLAAKLLGAWQPHDGLFHKRLGRLFCIHLNRYPHSLALLRLSGELCNALFVVSHVYATSPTLQCHRVGLLRALWDAMVRRKGHEAVRCAGGMPGYTICVVAVRGAGRAPFQLL